MKQSRAFNPNVAATVGLCLQYVQNGYSAGWAGSSAWDAWTNRLAFRHADRNFPSGVIIPVWFSGTWQGNYYGHVAALDTNTGKVYTSPYYKTSGHEVYNSIDALMNTFRGAMPDIKYVGWSEDIGGVRVITQGGIMRKIVNAANWRWRMQRLHWQLVGNWDMSEQVFQSIVGQDPWTVVENWSDHPNANKAMEYQKIGQMAVQDKWQQQIYDLQKQVAELGKRPTQAQLNELTSQMSKISSDMKNAQAEAAQARKDLADNAKQQQAIKDEADSFLAALINSIRNLFGGK